MFFFYSRLKFVEKVGLSFYPARVNCDQQKLARGWMDSYLKERIISGKSFEKCDFTSLLCYLGAHYHYLRVYVNASRMFDGYQNLSKVMDQPEGRTSSNHFIMQKKTSNFPFPIWTYLPSYHDFIDTSVPGKVQVGIVRYRCRFE